jgi:hypothetical protein
VALCKRGKVEPLFSELKNLIGLRRLRLRRIKFVREQFYLAALAEKCPEARRLRSGFSVTSRSQRERNGALLGAHGLVRLKSG